MFLNKKLKSIQEAKNGLATCCGLRRHLFHIEVQDIYYGARRAFSNLSLGLAVAEKIIRLIGNQNHEHR